ncbi:hypothetical protein J4463_02595 [Candidatus Pacearchaeota archaeon]|nr:hypothetical protein [Candidatus Pacearchaeota archaeon]
MRWFLDMCIILYYVGEGDKEIFIKKSRHFVDEKGQKEFLLCHYIKDENLPRWIDRQKILFRELIKQINDKNYLPYSSEESKRLYERDRKKIIKLITLFRSFSDNKKIIKNFERAVQEIEVRINIFIKEKIDKLVIPVSDIDFELKSHIFTFLNLGSSIKNDSDAKTIASAIQENNNQNLTIITADKSDWNKELLQEVHNHYNLKKKYPKLPNINYLQDL